MPTMRVPQPVQDPMRLSNFLNVSITPIQKENGEEVDDWQPRVNITKLFTAGIMNIVQGESVAEIADKFYVNKNMF